MSDPTTPLPGGFEPPIFRLTVGRLNQLGHRSFNGLYMSAPDMLGLPPPKQPPQDTCLKFSKYFSNLYMILMVSSMV